MQVGAGVSESPWEQHPAPTPHRHYKGSLARQVFDRWAGGAPGLVLTALLSPR